MKRVWSFSVALCAVGMILLSGCGKADTAPEKNSDSDTEETTTSSVEPSSAVDETSSEVAVTKEAADPEPEPNAAMPAEFTMEDFKGFLPDDPVDSLELTAEEEKFSSMGPPQSEEDKIRQSSFVFETPVRIKAGNEYIKVDAPGYACPTMADVDEDGKMDLVVGQFASGKMRLFRNVSADSDMPEFAEEDWINSGGDVAEVPGVW